MKIKLSEENKKAQKIVAGVWQMPEMKKLLRVQIAAPIVATFCQSQQDERAVERGIAVADLLIKKVGL